MECQPFVFECPEVLPQECLARFPETDPELRVFRHCLLGDVPAVQRERFLDTVEAAVGHQP